MWSIAFGSKVLPPVLPYSVYHGNEPEHTYAGHPARGQTPWMDILHNHLHDGCWATSTYNSKQLCRDAWDYVIGKGLTLKDKFSDVVPDDLWPKHSVVDPSTNIPIRGPNKQLPWIVTVPLPFIEGIYDTSVHHPDFPFSSVFLSMPLKQCCRTVTMFLFLCEHHTDTTNCIHTSANHNLNAAIHAGHVCQDRIQTHKPLYILSHACVKCALMPLHCSKRTRIPHPPKGIHSLNGPVHSLRQIRRRLQTILQGLQEPTLVPTGCIPTLTSSYIIPWCVSLATTYPQTGHVSLGTTSPLLLESSACFQ